MAGGKSFDELHITDLRGKRLDVHIKMKWGAGAGRDESDPGGKSHAAPSRKGVLHLGDFARGIPFVSVLPAHPTSAVIPTAIISCLQLLSLERETIGPSHGASPCRQRGSGFDVCPRPPPAQRASFGGRRRNSRRARDLGKRQNPGGAKASPYSATRARASRPHSCTNLGPHPACRMANEVERLSGEPGTRTTPSTSGGW